MNDLDDFGFVDVIPNTLEAEKQHEQEQQQEMNDPDNFGFGDVEMLAPTHWKQSNNNNNNNNNNKKQTIQMLWIWRH